MRLLLIEDDVTLRETLAKQLIDAGFAVEQAADGTEGQYFATEYPIDLAIIDLGLPGVSGLDIIRKVRADGKTYPILILTARDRWEDKVDGLSAMGGVPGESMAGWLTTTMVLGQLLLASLGLIVLGKTAKEGTLWGNLTATAAMLAGVSGMLLATALWAIA